MSQPRPDPVTLRLLPTRVYTLDLFWGEFLISNYRGRLSLTTPTSIAIKLLHSHLPVNSARGPQPQD